MSVSIDRGLPMQNGELLQQEERMINFNDRKIDSDTDLAGVRG